MHKAVMSLFVVVAGVLRAQGFDAAESSGWRADPDLFVAPIHGAGETLHGRPYGLWASGPDYKVSFHEGMCFYPVLGATAAENLPLAWRTIEVSIAGVPLASIEEVPQPDYGDWRLDYDFGGFIESYDLRRDGVEQTFVIHHRPPLGGELIVRGRVSTRLHVEDVAPRHGELVFVDAEERPVMTYGAAFVVDAGGRRFAMQTGVAAEVITLWLDAESVAELDFPITVDPLLSDVTLDTPSSGVAVSGDLVYDAQANEIVVVYSRSTSLVDGDIYGRVYDANFLNGSLAFVNSTEFVLDRNPSVAFVGGSQKWIVAFEEEVLGSAFPHRIAYHIHQSGNHALDTSVQLLPQVAGSSRRNPDVGGTKVSTAGVDAVVLFEEDLTTDKSNTDSTEVYADIINTQTQTWIQRVRMDGGRPAHIGADREQPTVNQNRWEVVHRGLSRGRNTTRRSPAMTGMCSVHSCCRVVWRCRILPIPLGRPRPSPPMPWRRRSPVRMGCIS